MTRFVRALVVVLATLALASLLYVVGRRLAYPYDLEWMEGGMLCHALRLLEGKPLYPAPSLDFIPYLYTPLYPALVAALAKLFGLSYTLGRVVSIASFLGATALGYLFVQREGGSRSAALGAMALPAAAYVPTGTWYELARPDSLQLLLVTAALVVGWWGRRSHLRAALAAALMVAAFLAKQTTAPFMVALGIALFVSCWRVALTYVATLALLGIPTLAILSHGSGGWFWTYIFEIHQRHPFRPIRGFLAAPGLLALILGPGLVLLPWALRRRRSAGLLYACWIGLSGFVVTCVGYGTQWAFANALIPGVFFLSVAIGTAAGRLLAGEEAPVAPRPALVLTLLALALLAAPNGPARLLQPVVPPSWKIGPRALTGYDPRPYLPRPAERAAGDALIARLRAAPGEVLVPFHTFYAHLAGKRTFVHQMGVFDVAEARLPPPRGLAEAIAARRFAVVVMDDGIDGSWELWPGLRAHYRVEGEVRGPAMIAGTPLATRYVLVPR